MGGPEFGMLFFMMFAGLGFPSDLEPLPAEVVVTGMPTDCELLVFADVRGSYDRFRAFFDELSRQSFVTATPELADSMRELDSQVALGMGAGTAMLGFNPLTDITSVGLCGRMVVGSGGGDPVPDFLVLVRGTFPANLATTLGASLSMPSVMLSNGQSVPGTTEDGQTMGLASPSTDLLLFGTDYYLAPRVAGALTNEAASAGSDTLLSRLSSYATSGTFMFAGFQPGTQLRLWLSSEAPVTLSQLVGGLDRLVMVTGRDGAATLEAHAMSADGYRDWELLMTGMSEYMQAAPHAMRGLFQIAMGAISPDDHDVDEGLRLMARHRDEILTWVDSMGWLEDPEVTLSTDATVMLATITASGGSGGMPLTALMMGMGSMFFLAQ
jgi:hypothetical protein